MTNAEFVSDCSIPFIEYALTISYNTDTLGDQQPTTWEEFFDTEAMLGNRGFWDSASGGMFEAALLADGVVPDDLYLLDLGWAFAKLDTIKEGQIFYGAGDEPVQLLVSGEAPLIQAWNGRMFEAAQQGEPGANLAQEFMGHFVTDLEKQAANTEASAYSPFNADAFGLLDEEVAREMLTCPENAEKIAASIDYDYWAENYDEVPERFNGWKLQ